MSKGDASRGIRDPVQQMIEEESLAQTTPRIHPHAVLLGGQPGSGKSTLSRALSEEYAGRGGIAVVDVDRLRELSPRYLDLAKTDPVHAAGLTHEEARGLKNRLQDALIEGRRNFVLDGTMRSPAKLERLTERLKSEGYTVEARIVAFDAERSMARARLRFEKSLVQVGWGRFVEQKQHDEAYAGLAQSVRALEQRRLVDSVRIYDGGQREIYANALVNGRWQKEPAADQMLGQERSRPWTHAEHRGHVSDLSDIVRHAQQRESEGRIVVGDLSDQVSKLERAQQALEQIEQSTTYQRAHAFDTLRSSEALGRYPELDGAYKQLQAVRDGLSGGQSPEKNEAYLQARAALSAQLHRGVVPQGPVTREESRQVLEMAASHRRLVLRDGDALGRPVQGEVVAGSSQHVLVKVSDMVALAYERGKFDRAVSVGDRLVIEPGQEKHRVHEQNQAFERDHGRDPGLGRER